MTRYIQSGLRVLTFTALAILFGSLTLWALWAQGLAERAI